MHKTLYVIIFFQNVPRNDFFTIFFASSVFKIGQSLMMIEFFSLEVYLSLNTF
jgi:hypothetical protein